MASKLCKASFVKNIIQASRQVNAVSFHSAKILCNDQVTHTGQTWSEDDVRSARYIGREKQTNTRWAIDLIAKVPPKIVNSRIVACEGDPNPALGHPKVYINLDNHEPVACIYCGLRYQLSKDHHH